VVAGLRMAVSLVAAAWISVGVVKVRGVLEAETAAGGEVLSFFDDGVFLADAAAVGGVLGLVVAAAALGPAAGGVTRGAGWG